MPGTRGHGTLTPESDAVHLGPQAAVCAAHLRGPVAAAVGHLWAPTVQTGASSAPPSRLRASTHAACRAAPSATYSPGDGTDTGTPKIPLATAWTAVDRAAPPISSTRWTGTSLSRSASRPSARPHSMPSTAARATLAGVRFARVIPPRVPVASGRSGVRSPSR